MFDVARQIFSDENRNVRRKVAGIHVFLVFANIALWGIAFATFRDYPVALGTCFLAYSFGLRHAVDADHLAAIDNVTRKLMQHGKRPVSVGFFFSPGHSTIVVGLSAAVVVAAVAIKNRFGAMANLGNIAGTLISAFFLFAIAIMNFVMVTLRPIGNFGCGQTSARQRWALDGRFMPGTGADEISHDADGRTKSSGARGVSSGCISWKVLGANRALSTRLARIKCQ